MRIIFAGTPEFAAAHLQALLDDASHELLAVYTQPDRRAGRGKQLAASPVKHVAAAAGLPVQQPASLKTIEAQQQLAAYNADIMVVAAYGLLLPQAVLELPAFGCINVHASLLPRWRGAAPVERAIEAGDDTTGITIMQMDAGLDTGDMLLTASCPIAPLETGDSLRSKLVALGQTALLRALAQIAEGRVIATAQDNQRASYAHKLNKAEAALDWQQPAQQLARKIRAFTSALPCYAVLDGQRLKIVSASAANTAATTNGTAKSAATSSCGEILAVDKNAIRVACGNGVLVIDRVQAAGGRAMAVADLLNGKPGYFQAGMRFAGAA
ncbi:MAG: methionyl-tRNA formyltransferase [Pseudomonadales bacterium]|nr:methionyl-tRNA formyltransferase [Pseudomonadales bacterium]